MFEINSFLNQSNYPKKSVEITKNKYKFYKNFSKKINIPKYKLVKNIKQILIFAQKYKFPIILKPIDSSGSKDVLFIKNKRDLIKTIKLKILSFKKKKLVQKFISWHQISAEALINDDKCALIISDRNYKDTKKFHPYIIENGGNIPAKITSILKKKIEVLILKIAKELKIKFGPLKLDLAIKKKKIFVIEATIRFGGGRVAHDISKKIYNYSLVELYIEFLKYGFVSIDKFKYNQDVHCVNIFFIANKQIRMKLINIDIIKRFRKNILIFYLTKKNRELVNKPKWHGDRCGMVTVFHKNYSKCSFIAKKISNNITSQINYQKN